METDPVQEPVHQAPPPPPGYGYGPMPPPPSVQNGKTYGGVKSFYMAFLLGIIMSLMFLVVGLLAFSAMGNVTATTPAGLTADLVMLASLACFALILLLVVVVLVIVGVVRFNGGKSEFPPPHGDNVKKGVMFFLLAIVMFILQIAVPIVMTMNAIGSLQQTSMQQMWSDIRNSAVIQAAIGMMFSLFLALMFYMMIAGIALPGDKSKAKLGVVMFLLSGIMSIVVVLLVLPENMTNVNITAADMQNLMNAGYLSYAVQLVGFLLFFIAYMGVKKGMDGGAIKPGGAMPPQNMYGGI